MSKSPNKVVSRQAAAAARLLGSMIRSERIRTGMPQHELAERIGVSKGTIVRLEKGHPGLEIGTVFEAAAVLGIPLLQSDRLSVHERLLMEQRQLAVLPQRVRIPHEEVSDDF